jgi:hypothetical protein
MCYSSGSDRRCGNGTLVCLQVFPYFQLADGSYCGLSAVVTAGPRFSSQRYLDEISRPNVWLNLSETPILKATSDCRR